MMRIKSRIVGKNQCWMNLMEFKKNSILMQGLKQKIFRWINSEQWIFDGDSDGENQASSRGDKKTEKRYGSKLMIFFSTLPVS